MKILKAKIITNLERALHSPFGLQLYLLGGLVIFVNGFQPPVFLGTGEQFGFESFSARAPAHYQISEPGFADQVANISSAGWQEVLVEDEQGNLVKKMQPRKRETSIQYLVKSGDNISKIAHRFGLKISTLLWSNSLTSKSTLRVGQNLTIPPTDGVFYEVKSGDTLSEIAKTHTTELSKIYAYNTIKNNKISPGQKLFLPDAKKVFIAARPTPRFNNSGQLQSIGTRLRRPTKGILTQGFLRGHYAIDIANKLNTPIYAAAGGTVSKVNNSGWNWGFGKYVVIDHGNGVETLYAHNNANKVQEGEKVQTGQLVALMGNTGNVRGVTGIHLHFELRINGRKVNPMRHF